MNKRNPTGLRNYKSPGRAAIRNELRRLEIYCNSFRYLEIKKREDRRAWFLNARSVA